MSEVQTNSRINAAFREKERLGTAPAFPEVERKHWIELSDLNWWLIFVIYTVVALISAGTVYASELAQRGSTPYFYPLLWELTGHYTHFALSPLIVFGFSRLPILRRNWYWSVPAHVLLSAGFGVVHTLMMFGTRRVVYALLGLGVYDYGELGYRFLMEYHKQFLIYWLVYAVLRVLADYRKNREREREAAALKLKTSELQRQLSETQLQALRSQLNPHFLFNTLNMISSIMYDDVERADKMIAALSRMLRMSLQESVGAKVTLRREIEFLECAIELIQARFPGRVAIEIHCPPAAVDDLVPNLLLHTFVENAVKHQDPEQASRVCIEVKIERSATRLDLHVFDNGPGIPNVDKAMGKGVGLENTRQRLAALYGDRHEFNIVNRPEGGLHVHVSIPLETAPRLSASAPNPSSLEPLHT